MIELDKIDRALLHELDRDSRQNFSTISRTVKQGRELVSYRYDRLLDRGILKACRAIIDPSRLGYSIFRTVLKLDNQPKKRTALMRSLIKDPRVYWLAECHGSSDLMFSITARYPGEFTTIQSSILSRFSSIVVTTDVRMVSALKIYNKSFLIQRQVNSRALGGPPLHASLNDVDLNLCIELTRNARTDVSSLAEQLGITRTTVRSRIEKLMYNKIIVGFYTDLDLSRIGFMYFKASIFIKSFKSSDMRKLEEQSKTHPNILVLTKTIGHCPLELDIVARDYQEFTLILDELRETNQSFFRDAEIVMIRTIHEKFPFSR